MLTAPLACPLNLYLHQCIGRSEKKIHNLLLLLAEYADTCGSEEKMVMVLRGVSFDTLPNGVMSR